MANTNSTTPKTNDEIVIALGEELEALYREKIKAEEAIDKTTDAMEVDRLFRIQQNTSQRMDDICHALSSFEVSTPEAAAIQIRALFNSLDVDDKDIRLLSSINGYIEQVGNFGSDRWAGGYYLPGSDPFDRVGV